MRNGGDKCYDIYYYTGIFIGMMTFWASHITLSGVLFFGEW